MLEAEKLKYQTSSSASVLLGNNTMPQLNKSQPTINKPHTQPEASSSKPTQDSSIKDTLHDPQVVEPMKTIKETVKIAKSKKSQGKNVKELCALLGINI
ncbi:hypothetical protein TNCV_1586311 [Trichonephila clavipes]|nr:hypothetical protein TNCV_1586311 [Trichonephila clavipes]